MYDEFVSIAVAGQAADVSERTIRRWVAAGHVPAMSAPGGRLVRLADVTAYAAQQRTTDSGVAGRPLSMEMTGRPADMAGQASEGVYPALVAELVATIERQAEELGALRERLRARDAAPETPAALQSPDPGWRTSPVPTAPSVPSWRRRVARWLRGSS